MNVISGANLHKNLVAADSDYNRIEYQISKVFTREKYERNSVGGRMITQMVRDILKAEELEGNNLDDVIIFLDARCEHKHVDSYHKSIGITEGHTCSHDGNTESQVKFYYKLGFEIDSDSKYLNEWIEGNKKLVTCHSGIGNVRMVYAGTRDIEELDEILKMERPMQRAFEPPATNSYIDEIYKSAIK
ncbi:MAG: hypothetical protein KKF44_01690 [Nanoarchaeota archaeon]|nr:hypothetical protein [Nanoarchaeota archaeon]